MTSCKSPQLPCPCPTFSFFPTPGHLWASSFQGLPLPEVLAPLSPAVCLWDPGFPSLGLFLICKWGITVFVHMVFWKHPAQCLAGSRWPSESVCLLPPRTADSSVGRVPLPAPLFPLAPRISPQPSQRGDFMVPYFRETVVVVMGTHTGSFQKVMERCPQEWELSLPFWLSGPHPGSCPALSHGRRPVPSGGRECAVILFPH